jgi:hypothetical protein
MNIVIEKYGNKIIKKAKASGKWKNGFESDKE